MRQSPAIRASRPLRKPALGAKKPAIRAPRLDAEARAEFLAELERRMGVKPILGRTGMRPGY
ncbi:MAG: hypothetical protein Q4G36_06625 [Paracoccus sp. (in: a-proteobacteria)]|nr:hypothetical protein [Paracoccus sp. (in: a-proteobacteria)]